MQPLPFGKKRGCKRQEKSAKESCRCWGDLQGEPTTQDSLRAVSPEVRRGQSPKHSAPAL